MSTYKTTIELENGDEFKIAIDFDATPAERMTHDYPGCDAEVEINYIVTSDGKEIELSKEDTELMEEEILDWLVSQEDERWDY